eukprot:COSAG02_NODE_4640_length_5141_cov_2.504760_3_plen_89_part_00
MQNSDPGGAFSGQSVLRAFREVRPGIFTCSAELQTLTIKQMREAQLKIDSAVKTKVAAQISKCFDDAVACVDGFDSGRLMLTIILKSM